MPVTSPTYRPADFAYEPFRPALQERFLARFYQAARTLVHQAEDQREETIRTEVEWAISSQGNPRQQALYQAVWLLLRDLLHVGWTPRWNEVTATFEVAPPPPYEKPRNQAAIQAHKQGRRDVMAPERHTRLVQAAEFIQRMEAPSRGLPITALLADGVQLEAPTAQPDNVVVRAAFKHLLSNIQRAINDINAEGLCTPIMLFRSTTQRRIKPHGGNTQVWR